MLSLILSTILYTDTIIQTPKNVECMANTLYAEARGEPLEGQLAVANVIINRKNDENFPDTICEVVNDPGAFVVAVEIKNKKAWNKIYKLSKDVIDGSIVEDPSNGALYFHTVDIDKKPKWSNVYAVSARIKNHIFYK